MRARTRFREVEWVAGLTGMVSCEPGSPRLVRKARADRRPDLRQAMEGTTCRTPQHLATANVPSSQVWSGRRSAEGRSNHNPQ